MKTLLTSSKWRWFTSFVAVALIIVTSFFLQNASGKSRRFIPVSGFAQRTAIYRPDVAGFTFSTPQALTHPPIPATPGVSLKDQDVEPEIKVDIFGNIYVTAIHGVPGGIDLWKSTDQGNTFVYLGEPDGAQDKCNVMGMAPCVGGAGGGDDSIDVSTGGYLYVSSLYLGGLTVSTSMDGGTGGTVPGQAWQVNATANGNPPIPVNDRQWLAAYGPQTVYMTFDQAPAPGPLWFVKSTDAGKTWSVPMMLTGVSAIDRTGTVAVDQYNGNIYTTFEPAGNPSQINLLKSTDGGTTWTTTTAYAGPNGTSVENSFVVSAVDRGGNVHIAFVRSNGTTSRTNAHVFLISSSDAGATWTAPVQIDNGPGNNSTVMPWIVAGSAGVVDVTWYGSTMSSPDNTPANSSEYWNVSFAQVTNALSPTPAIAQTIVVGGVHALPICSQGGNCAGNTRDLAEYYTVTLDGNGSAHIAYPDELNYCAAHPAANCFAHTYYTKQTGGPSAYTPPAPPAPATFAANLNPISSSGSSAGAEPNMRADSHNCLFSAAPGAPNVWKSTNAGMSFFNLPNPVADETGLTGGDEEILPVPQANGARPDQLYFADLGVSTVHIRKSTDGGGTWFAPGTGGAAGEVSASVDRQWMAYDRSGANQTVYLWEHEFVSQVLRMSALTNDTAWSAFADGMTDPELNAPPGSTLGNTVPGPCFVDPATHQVYGFLSASTVTTNAIGAPTGKLPNVWEADGQGTFTSPVPPGPFTNHPVFKGVLDSPTNPAPPAGAATIGSNTANLFNGATIDSAGNIYVTWATPNARTGLYDVWFASSHDHGQTYYGPFRINQNGTQGNMPWIAAGDNGRVEIVFYGTTDTQDPTSSTTDRWNVMFAQSLNAADREPIFTVTQASDHIMHVGPICNVGILCGSGTRQLLDFFQVAIGPDGLANIAYADTGSGNGASHVSYARQSSGPSARINPTFPTCLPGPPAPLKAVSRKFHGSIVMPFDIDLLPPAPGIECRRNTGADNSGPNQGKDHEVVVTFPAAVTLSGVTVATNNSADSPAPSATFSGNNTASIVIDLHNIKDVRRVTITLNNVSDGTGNGPGPVPIPMGALVGDTNADTNVDGTDVSQTKSQSGNSASTGSAFREDVNLDGFVDGTDVSFVKSKSGGHLP